MGAAEEPFELAVIGAGYVGLVKARSVVDTTAVRAAGLTLLTI